MVASSIRTRMRSRWRYAAGSLSSYAAPRSWKSPTAFSTKSCGCESPCRPQPDMDRDALRRYLEFYQDLGVNSLYVGQAGSLRPIVNRPSCDEPKPATGTPLPGLAPANDTLLKILEDIGDCKRCRLHTGRHK